MVVRADSQHSDQTGQSAQYVLLVFLMQCQSNPKDLGQSHIQSAQILAACG